MRVRWEGNYSNQFKISNRVRQGGILSPLHFNLYVNEISIKLNGLKMGCVIGGCIINHLMYADDLVIMSPSQKGLQKLVDMCNDIGQKLYIEFNEAKTECMIFRSKKDKTFKYENIILYGKPLAYCSKFIYLGYIILDTLSHDDDVKRQMCAIYARGNIF